MILGEWRQVEHELVEGLCTGKYVENIAETTNNKLETCFDSCLLNGYIKFFQIKVGVHLSNITRANKTYKTNRMISRDPQTYCFHNNFIVFCPKTTPGKKYDEAEKSLFHGNF